MHRSVDLVSDRGCLLVDGSVWDIKCAQRYLSEEIVDHG